MKLLAIIEETVREARARKTLIGVFIFSTIMIVIAILIFQSDFVQTNFHKSAADVFPKGKVQTNGPNHDAQNQQLAKMLLISASDFVGTLIAGFLYFFTVCIGIFATAGLVTSIMEKGTIDLLLSKPVPRWLYIAGRYLGAVCIIFAEVAYFVLGLWIAAGFSFGSWSPRFLIAIPFVTLGFAGIFAVVTLVGVLWRSSWLSIILGITIYFITGAVIPIFEKISETVTGSTVTGVFAGVATGLHWMLPQMSDVSHNMSLFMLHQPVDWVPIAVTAALAAAYVGLSAFAFSKKEF
jgi:ABC-type transport system involved in multi-copper enzyme maturation permease subunit